MPEETVVKGIIQDTCGSDVLEDRELAVTRGRRLTGSPASCPDKLSWCPRPDIIRSRSRPASPPAQSCASWKSVKGRA